MQTLKIEIPDGCIIDSFDKSTGEVIFKEKAGLPPMDRIKTVADILSDNGLSQAEFDKQCEGLTPDEVAYRIIKMLAKSLNEGWTPNWKDEEEYKYYPWFWMDEGSSGFRFLDCGGWDTNLGVGSRLCFKSRELAEYAGNQFTDVYKQFMTI